jgi:dipicolinate synthase subunit A
VSVTTTDLTGRIVAVVGGDEREQEIARLAAMANATVRAYGFPWPEDGIAGVARTASAAMAVEGADYVLLPIPGIATSGEIYAPQAPEPIVPDQSLLGRMRPGAAIVLGRADAGLRAAAAATGVVLIEYEGDAALMLRRGPAIVEGVLAVAIRATPITIHASEAGVIGFGNIGGLLARGLVAMGASVHVFARNPVQRAGAYAAHCEAHELGELSAVAPRLDMLFSTAPARVVDRGVLSVMTPGSLVVDLASPPGGVDLAAAEALGLRAVWARGMGSSAPRTVGRSQWAGIVERIVEHERSRTAHAS